MEIIVNSKGNLELDIKDLLQHIDDEQAESLIQALAWDSRMWNVLKEAIKNEHGSFSYNEDLLKLRQMNDLAREHGIRIETPEHKTLHFFSKEAHEIDYQYMPELEETEEE